MGKKTDKTLANKSFPSTDDAADKSNEPYRCTGNFQIDFNELCNQMQMYRVPPVIARARQYIPLHESHVNHAGKPNKKLSHVAPVNEEEDSQEDREAIELIGFKPKTFSLKDNTEFMKPCIQVDLETSDKFDTVTDVYIRGWRLEENVLSCFKLCFPTMSKLHTLNFWRVGFSSERIKHLADILVSCEHVKVVNIDANDPLENENYYELITDQSHLTKLRLRYCHITSAGAKGIGRMLGSGKRSNGTLLMLDLNGNKLGNEGTKAIAKGLRTNRTLLSLSLSNNELGDEACRHLAQTISRFTLTDEEILVRRMILSERNVPERAKSTSSGTALSRRSSISPTSSRRRDSKGSLRSGGDKDKSRSKMADKNTAGKGKKDAKDDKLKLNVKKDEKPASKKSSAGPAPELAKNTSNLSKGSNKAPAKSGGSRASKTMPSAEVQDYQPDYPEVSNPLMEKPCSVGDGALEIPGNFVLILLNLSRNRITEKGLQYFVDAILFQDHHMTSPTHRVTGTGMMKFLLKNNKFSEDDSTYKKLLDLMVPRDPFRKPVTASPDIDND